MTCLIKILFAMTTTFQKRSPMAGLRNCQTDSPMTRLQERSIIKTNTFRTVMMLTALLLLGLSVTGQNVSQGAMPDIPPSPQAVAFNRLGDYQINNNYGTPDISIPLFEIDFHGYKIPMMLQYEAAPLKPGYNYDVTGVGWTLSGNSCVSRTIKDIADECASTPFALDGFQLPSGSDKEYLYYHYNHLLDQLNFQYDVYNIVLPSGRTIPFFMYKTDGVMTYYTMSLDSNVKISCGYSPNSINAFTVTDENGVTYNYTLPEKASNIFQNDPNADRNVTWLLESIDIPAKGTIYYQYTTTPVVINTQNILREPVVSVCRLYDSWSEWPNEQKFNVKGHFQSQSPRYEMRFLKRIIYGPTTVDFNYKEDRQHMKEIVVSENNDTIRKYTLNVYGSSSLQNWHLNSLVVSGQNGEDRLVYGFSYYNITPGEYTDFWGNCCNAGPTLYGNNGQTINNYGLNDLGNFNMFFAYDGIGLDRTGIQNQLNSHGILAQLIENEEGDHYYYYKLKLQTTTNGDTRIPLTPDKHGVLTSITYPNGGQTFFQWENHRFPTATAADGDIIPDRRFQRIMEGGGFRIESIKNYTADGHIASADYYRYGYTLSDVIQRDFPMPLPDHLDTVNLTFNDTVNHHIGCGEAVVDPNLFTFMSGFSYSRSLSPGATSLYSYADPVEFRKMLVGQDSRFKNISQNQDVQGIPMWWEVTFSANKFRSLIGGRRPVVYPEITVYHGQPFDTVECKSKTVYRYDIYKSEFPNYTQSSNYLSDFNQTTVSDTAYFEPLIFQMGFPALSCNEHPADRHQLKSKSDYSYNAASGTWELVSEETYDYKNHNISESGFVFESVFSRENYYPNYENLSYNQIGFSHPLYGAHLRDFYKGISQKLGRFTMTKKSTTFLRQGGTRSKYNTSAEEYSYLYPGVLRVRQYSDLLKCRYSDTYDKRDTCTYIGDINEGTDTVIAAMKSRNMLASLYSVETYSVEFSTHLSGSKIDYGSFGNNLLPSKLYEWNGDIYEESIKVLSYDSYGNPTEIVNLKTGDENTGTHTIFIWDTYGRYMTAMIWNATMSQVLGGLSQLTGNSQSRFSTLKSMLPNAQIQTWDYLPLVGVSSHTDINGQTFLYEYDGLGRLKSKKRVVNSLSEPEILHQYEYNYLNPSF